MKRTARLLCALLALLMLFSAVPLTAGAEYLPENGAFIFNNQSMLDYLINPHNLSYSFDSSEKTAKLTVNSTASDPDPYVSLDLSRLPSKLNAANCKYVTLVYKVPTEASAKATSAEMFLCAGSVTAPAAGYSTVFSLTKGAIYTAQIINLSSYSWWSGDINAIRLDPFCNASYKDTMYLDSIIFTGSAAAAQEAASKRLSELPDFLHSADDMYCTRYEAEKYTSPLWKGNIVYNEAVYPIADKNGNMVYTLMYTPEEIISVYNATFSARYTEGKDYTVSGNKLTFLSSGSISPVSYYKIHPQSNPNNYGWDKYYNRTAAGDGKWEYWGQSSEFFAGYINITYTHRDEWTGFVPENKAAKLPITSGKINNNQSMNVVFFGDSICGGANSSSYRNVYPYAEYWNEQIISTLQSRYGCSNINAYYSSVGGSTASDMLPKVQDSVIKYAPDLVFIEFGVNDCMNASQSSSGSRDKVKSEFYSAVNGMITEIRKSYPNCEFVLVAPFYSNPYCHYMSYFEACRDALVELEGKYSGVATADVTSMHKYLMGFKDYLDFSGDNMCHPNDFMSRIFAQVCLQTILPVEYTAYVPNADVPAITSVTAAGQITDTGSAVFNASATGRGLTYSWSGKLPDGVSVTGADSPSLLITVSDSIAESFTAALVCTVTDIFGRTVTSAPAAFTYTSPGIMGDINTDGKVNLQDLFFLKLCVKGTTSPDSDAYRYSDLNGDNKVNISDIFKLKLILKGYQV